MYLSEKKDSLAMIQKILIGILTGIFIGIVITSIFATRGTSLIDLFLTQITATSMITGVFCGIYTHYSKTKLRKFIFSVGIGIIVFQVKYLITGHDFNPPLMGAFVGAGLAGMFAARRKIKKISKKNKRRKKIRRAS